MSVWLWVMVALTSWFAVSFLMAAIIARAANFRRELREERQGGLRIRRARAVVGAADQPQLGPR